MGVCERGRLGSPNRRTFNLMAAIALQWLKRPEGKNAHFVQELTELGGVHWMDKTTSLLDVLGCFMKRCSQHFRVQCTW